MPPSRAGGAALSMILLQYLEDEMLLRTLPEKGDERERLLTE